MNFFFTLLKFRKLFYYSNYKKKKDGVILVEYFKYYPSLIGFAYFIKVLRTFNNSKIICYNPHYTSFFRTLLIKVRDRFSIIYYFFKIVGICKFIFIKKNIENDQIKKDMEDIKKKISSKDDVLKLKYLGIDIGKELYDEYLRVNNKSEVDLNDPNFYKCVRSMLIIINHWIQYFKNNKVNAVLVSHSVYFMALIMRVAFKFNVPVYSVAAQNFFKISPKDDGKQACCKYFSKAFKSLSKLNKDLAVKYAKTELDLRFSGKLDKKLLLDQDTDVRLFTNKKSSFKLNLDDSKINILVAAHCFNDAIHVYGDSFYTDYKDWMLFLFKASKLRGYNIFIKVHPAQFDQNLKHFNKLKKKFDFHLLPKNMTVSESLNQNFDYVTTVYGSVGHEYPLFNKPVINASNNGPHCSYNFNTNPQSKSHYEDIILKLTKKNYSITFEEKNEIYEFYFMRYLSEYSFLDNWTECMKELKKNYNSYRIINFFMKNYNLDSHNKKILDLKDFINSGSLRLIADNNSGVSNKIGYIN
jgi:hypothetical protein|tara:strand:- start:26398 stop:27972 length:1575 start_codon:yes stop_codon:yes gene_type:complete